MESTMSSQENLVATNTPWISAWLGKGYVHAWFSWIEWITLTVVLISVCRKLWPNLSAWPEWYFWPVAAVATFSGVLVFLSGIIGFSTYLVDATGAKSWPKWLQWILVGGLTVLVPASMTITLVPIVVGILAGG